MNICNDNTLMENRETTQSNFLQLYKYRLPAHYNFYYKKITV